ncbi:hypothetical protein VOLCADRAFT_118968 [Volvox carteri f. nagariensis]|uniref:Protein kintoun n=1 Tax=Volvox carteri f. nagariensis TaxID=3068 RepID=D8U927_VOLCA|nr:uncharacterized protein VOLCADRAFT_118968 [Volvox carteri f. nagariensis]EFJ43676.1 hypothetical protein VOLCADRAFT_118968 [Volvox carteri f. nagariensis]|eukprot:XP_002955157.1 hypothetical protein VOLCADRAFT_118968 [Volvox carteri f. nagariensis]
MTALCQFVAMAPTTKDQDSLEKGLRDLNLTNEELNKFEKAFKDPEFLKLFEEYAKEVSDPKVKAETDQYLRELEEQGRAEDVYGKGVVLINPKPAMVLKSKVLGSKDAAGEAGVTAPGGSGNSRRDTLTPSQKVFINICTSEKVDRYSLKQATDATGRSGQQLSIPITMGLMRLGTDKQGQPAAVYDIVVHPETVEFATRSSAVMSSLAETALDQVEQVSRSRLLRNWRRLNTRFKATEGCTEPPVQCIRTGEGGEAVGGRLKPRSDVPAVVDVKGATAAPPPAAGAAAAAPATSRSTFSFDRKPKSGGGQPPPPPQQQQQNGGGGAQWGVGKRDVVEMKEEEVKDPRQPGYLHSDGCRTPEWVLVHRGTADLGEAWGDAGRGLLVDSQVPKELLVRVTLPLVSSAAAVDVDVGERRLTLKVPGRYCLDVALPYKVDESKGKAKFDKARKQLEITLPVVPPPLPAVPLRAPGAATAAAAVRELPASLPANGAAAAENALTQDSELAAPPPAAAAAVAASPEMATAPAAEAPSPADPAAAAVAVATTESELGVAATTAASTAEGTGEARWDLVDDDTSAQRQHVRDGERATAEEMAASEEGGAEGLPALTENERRWRELHTRREVLEVTKADPGAEEAEAVGMGEGGVAASPGCCGGGEAAAAPAAASTLVSGKAAAWELESTVMLQPRLRRDLAMELD